MESPYYHIYQRYIDSDTGVQSTKEVANAATLPLAESILSLLEEKASEIGDPNITFECIAYDEHPSVTEHWSKLANWSMLIQEYPDKYPNDIDLGKEVRKTYLKLFKNA